MSVNPRFFRFAVIFLFLLNCFFLRVKRRRQLIHECYGYIIPHKCGFGNPFSEKKLIFFYVFPEKHFFSAGKTFFSLPFLPQGTEQYKVFGQASFSYITVIFFSFYPPKNLLFIPLDFLFSSP